MIELNYFASIRERLGLEREEMALPEGVLTASDLMEHLAASRGAPWDVVLRESTVLVAVNQVMTHRNARLKDGDEVAFFPPVTGG